ncbi:hypothetical protein BSLG_002578 [Batrachochytrium salamandrivorans]|nr:hypothetical protein BSLG_002578 [Batrachochytrium salamandrivorans]
MLPSSTPPSLLRQFSQLYRPTSPPISQLPKFRRIGNRHSNNGTHGNGFRNYSSSTAYPMSASQLRLNEQRTNIRTTIYYTMSVFVGFIGLTYAAVPLYKMLCTETGVDGTPLTSIGHKFEATSMVPVAHSNPIRIIFDSSIADTMQWKFVPETRQIQVVPGETALAFFRASNPGAEDMVGISTYSVTPAKAAQYFNKIQCFCFEEQKLVSGEEIDMPVFFYIDPEFAYDPWMSDVKTITLHYTFFKSKYQ